MFADTQVYAQPYSRAVFNGQETLEQIYEGTPETDSNFYNFCFSYLEIDSIKSKLVNTIPQDWKRLPDQLYDPSEGTLKSIGRGGMSLYTPSGATRFWLVTSGHHTWDSTMRKINLGPLAPRAAWKYGRDRGGTNSYYQNLILPVRDTPGVFRHLVLGFSPNAPWRLNIASGTFDRIYNYRLDARWDSSMSEPEGAFAGNSPHARYSPDPDKLIDPYAIPEPDDAPELAVAWHGSDSAYARNPADRGPLETISRFVAIPHGNGRDWWVIAFGGQSSPRTVAVFLLDETGFNLQTIDENAIPFRPHENHYWHAGMQPTVSQQGDKIALHAMELYNSRYTYYDFHADQKYLDDVGVALWDFDRCSGTLSTATHLNIEYKPTNPHPINPDFAPARGGGCAFSPSGKYLYYTEESYLARVDVTSSDILGSEQIVMAPDTLLRDAYNIEGILARRGFSSLHTTFGSDGIMLTGGGGSAPNSDMYWNLDAENPEDVQGGLSVLKAPCLNSNKYIAPYYELYDLEGSSCDTLGVDGWSYGCATTWTQASPDSIYLTTGASVLWNNQTLSSAGPYSFTRRSPAGCDSTWRAEVFSISSTQRSPEKGTFKVYPNPLKNDQTLSIEWSAPAEAGDITIFDPTGRLLASYPVDQGTKRLGSIELPTRLASGLYTLRYRSASNTETVQLLVFK